MSVGIIDYGMGNLKSVTNALEFIGVNSFTSSKTEELMKADRLILPGVGAYKDAMFHLRKNNLDKYIKEVVKRDIPILGICLGMQLLFQKSSEHGEHTGLGLLNGDIVKFDIQLKVPHMGWNNLIIKKKSPLFEGVRENSHVYFVHSYHLETSEDIVLATTYYGKEVQIAAQKNNVFAVQFHPEKSGEIGLKILENFVKLGGKNETISSY